MESRAQLPVNLQSTQWRCYNLVMVGGPGVGKKSLTVQFVRNYFASDDEISDIIEDSYRKRCVIDDDSVFLEISGPGQLDTEHRVLWEQFIRPGDGFLLIYSIASHNSFEEISKLCHDIVSVKGEDPPPFVLVGNKCDLEHARQVGIDEGRDLATHLGCGFFETSTKYRVGIDEVFYTLVREIRKHIRVKDKGTPPARVKRIGCISYLSLPMRVVLIWAGFFTTVAVIYGSCCRVNETGIPKRSGMSNDVLLSNSSS